MYALLHYANLYIRQKYISIKYIFIICRKLCNELIIHILCIMIIIINNIHKENININETAIDLCLKKKNQIEIKINLFPLSFESFIIRAHAVACTLLESTLMEYTRTTYIYIICKALVIVQPIRRIYTRGI